MKLVLNPITGLLDYVNEQEDFVIRDSAPAETSNSVLTTLKTYSIGKLSDYKIMAFRMLWFRVAPSNNNPVMQIQIPGIGTIFQRQPNNIGTYGSGRFIIGIDSTAEVLNTFGANNDNDIGVAAGGGVFPFDVNEDNYLLHIQAYIGGGDTIQLKAFDFELKK